MIEKKTPEETYDIVYWLFNVYGRRHISSKNAIISWINGDVHEFDDPTMPEYMKGGPVTNNGSGY